MHLKPVSDRIILRPEPKEEKKTSMGIILPGARDEALDIGEVVAVGPGCFQAGVHIPLRSVAVGDRVVYEGGVPVTITGERLVILFEQNIIAVVKE